MRKVLGVFQRGERISYLGSMGRRWGRGMTVTGLTVVGDGGVFLLSFVSPLGLFSCGASAIGATGPPIAISTALGAEHLV